MLKSFKARGLAAAGAVALVAPFTFMSGAMAAPGTAVISSVTSATGNFEAGTALTVTGSGCAATGTNPAQTATLRLRGPGSPASITDPVVATGGATVLGSGTFQGTLAIPSNARVGDSFLVTAFCTESGIAGTEAGGGVGNPVTVQQASVLSTSGGVTGVTGITSGSVTGITSTSGATTATSGATTAGVTTGATTGVATPIVQTPTFTG